MYLLQLYLGVKKLFLQGFLWSGALWHNMDMDIFGGGLIGGLSNEQLALIVLIQIWDLIWKSLALWRAARSRDVFWFVLLILVNSAGLLPAFYLFYMSKSPKRKILHIKMPSITKVGGDKVEDIKKSLKKKNKK
ncbi:MAG: hypothetical protein A2119_00980 [Candidatus Colwellbacteria bacterium GWA2_46_10]|uniref:DUF5652 domain-containing protein n=2 Tax=Parcubacteria group TaxID=1794811 RepID=A0A1G1YUY8_9BACT|nr:MAG: hypothetical protein A2119_00980 [Candidatus Colwellbacteria bacterium GWA2_46_10]